MERTKKSDDKIRYKKIGGGSLRLNGRIIKPGEVFSASPSQIPPAFKDVVIPLEEVKDVPAPTITVSNPQYEMRPRGKSRSLFDVVNANGKVLNSNALTKEVALQLIQDLSR